MKRTVLVTAVLAILVCATAVWSQGGPPPPGGPGGHGGPGGASITSALMLPPSDMIDRLTEQLSLTEDQATKLKAILVESDKTIPALVKTMGEKCKALRAAVATGTDLDAAVKAALDAEDAVTAACLDTWAKIRTDSGLTADQLAQLSTGPGGPPPGGGCGTTTTKNRR